MNSKADSKNANWNTRMIQNSDFLLPAKINKQINKNKKLICAALLKVF